MAKILELSDADFRRWALKKIKLLEGLIDDLYQKDSDWRDAQQQIVDEALDKAARAQRAVRRVKNEFDGHTHE